MIHEIYLDNNATTRTDQRVVEAMIPYFVEDYGNPASTIYLAGARARDAMELARQQVSDLLRVNASEIFFTGGSTEANNWVPSLARALGRSQRPHVITTAVEHASVLQPLCDAGRRRDLRVSVCPVMRDGTIDLDHLEHIVTDDTVLVSVQAANNEIHTIQPMPAIRQVLAGRDIVLYSDATQIVGKLPFGPKDEGIDICTLSFHKMFGPKGVGALYVSDRLARRLLPSVLSGGGQERNLRSGTPNVPGIVGGGVAAAICAKELTQGVEPERSRALRDRLLAGMVRLFPGMELIGSEHARLPAGINACLDGVDANAWAQGPVRIAFSRSSACSTRGEPVSHVLRAIGLSNVEAENCVRLAVGRFTKDEEIDLALQVMGQRSGRTVCGVTCQNFDA